ncbi:MAG: hypothetical protein FWG10_05320 [Eubacteriaceae bacterium]|nr:hypothetical protein [Eubacteriaceae bacterium]
METEKIYVLLSKTHTGVARLIRLFGKTHYNHAAISLDADLNELYAFARPQHYGIMLARLVHESVYRYTLGKEDYVDVVIFELDVTPEQHQWVRETIESIQNDNEYMYNYLSVLTYPFFKGFSTYKAFSCIEFAMYILKGLDCCGSFTENICRYMPGDLLDLLPDSIIYQGNLLDYKHDDSIDTGYYSPITYKLVKDSAIAVKKLCQRSLFKKRYKAS